MDERISINSATSGKYSTEKINGRDHIVTQMMSIEGDSVMNRVFYPNAVVAQAMPQLDLLPAPAEHPKVNGKPVSAFNPLAINANSFGGFVRYPRLEGKRVINDLAVDVDVARKTDKGREVIKRIKSGKRMGVSTGLVASVDEGKGKHNNQEFDRTTTAISFDHVAVLLDTAPAGENTYTLNHGVIEPNVNQQRPLIMYEKLETNLGVLAEPDRIKLTNMNAQELLAAVNHEITVDEAIAVVKAGGFQVNQVNESDLNDYLANQEAFAEFKQNKADSRAKVVDFVCENSKMKREQVETLSDVALQNMADSVAPKNDFSGNAGGQGGGSELELLNDNELPED